MDAHQGWMASGEFPTVILGFESEDDGGDLTKAN
jgi:hypothetical protein